MPPRTTAFPQGVRAAMGNLAGRIRRVAGLRNAPVPGAGGFINIPTQGRGGKGSDASRTNPQTAINRRNRAVEGIRNRLLNKQRRRINAAVR